MNKIEEALVGWWGPRCDTRDEDCPCCQAWDEYTIMKASHLIAERAFSSVEPKARQK